MFYMIIRSIRHRGLKRLIETNSPRGIQGDLVNRVRNIITALILAGDMNDFIKGAPPGWRVHSLSGNRKDTWSVSTSGNWRITFEEEVGYLDFLDLEDYH
jgi:toxin HigB-1